MALQALLTDSDHFPFDSDDRAELAAGGVELVELPGHDPDEIAEAGREAQAVFIYYGKFTRELISQLGCCRVLARCGTGYDNIDVAAARERGIAVVYVPGFASTEVADHTMALLLACARKLVSCHGSLRSGQWPTYRELRPMARLRGQALGLIGFGAIGREVARRANAFGLVVSAHDPLVPDDEFDEFGARRLSLEVLLQESDFVSLHVPLTRETRHFIGVRELRLMKTGATLINTSRGEVVDERALVDALLSAHLGSAGLDVFEVEPMPAGHVLSSLDAIVLSPHSASFSQEALAEVRRRSLVDVLRVVRGEPPLNPVAA